MPDADNLDESSLVIAAHAVYTLNGWGSYGAHPSCADMARAAITAYLDALNHSVGDAEHG